MRVFHPINRFGQTYLFTCFTILFFNVIKIGIWLLFFMRKSFKFDAWIDSFGLRSHVTNARHLERNISISPHVPFQGYRPGGGFHLTPTNVQGGRSNHQGRIILISWTFEWIYVFSFVSIFCSVFSSLAGWTLARRWRGWLGSDNLWSVEVDGSSKKKSHCLTVYWEEM